ncbi:hypothetical protein RRG08_037433 [Elysia crispata]|uniref:Uncharacterized protein n=1 Tax=Elysia crispata TaxID=231223 RepID=A0AAE0Y4P2_9GAST|nr:hypothetical protein RRG08_037433 [Elysia crispata]
MLCSEKLFIALFYYIKNFYVDHSCVDKNSRSYPGEENDSQSAVDGRSLSPAGTTSFQLEGGASTVLLKVGVATDLCNSNWLWFIEMSVIVSWGVGALNKGGRLLIRIRRGALSEVAQRAQCAPLLWRSLSDQVFTFSRHSIVASLTSSIVSNSLQHVTFLPTSASVLGHCTLPPGVTALVSHLTIARISKCVVDTGWLALRVIAFLDVQTALNLPSADVPKHQNSIFQTGQGLNKNETLKTVPALPSCRTRGGHTPMSTPLPTPNGGISTKDDNILKT